LVASDTHTIDISFKHSDMSFERFDYSTLLKETGQYITLNSGLLVPDEIRRTDTGRANITGTEESDFETIKPLPKEVEFVTLDRISDREVGSTATSSFYLQDTQSDDPLGDINKDDKKAKFMSGLKDAGNKLLVATKTAVTNEAQRRLNDQFRLLNNTIDKVRNAYGLGRMSPPTNVYTQENLALNQLRGAVRNFVGDVGGAFLDSL
jgi:hypothetical protein